LLSEGSIVKSVQRENFQSLETEMKQMTVGNRIEKLGLLKNQAKNDFELQLYLKHMIKKFKKLQPQKMSLYRKI